MNCLELRATEPAAAVCEVCGQEIESGESCYEMPDGLRVCGESDCLRDWAAPYLVRAPERREEWRG